MDELEKERQRLKGEIDSLQSVAQQKDPDGTASADALLAQKRLDSLQSDYRQILVAQAGHEPRTPTPLAQMVRIDAQGKVIAADDTTTPAVKLVDPNDQSKSVDLPNPKQGAQPSGQYQSVLDPRDPAGKKIIGFVDTGDNSYHQLPAEPDPSTGRQIVNTGTKILAVDKDNNVTTLATVDKS